MQITIFILIVISLFVGIFTIQKLVSMNTKIQCLKKQNKELLKLIEHLAQQENNHYYENISYQQNTREILMN